MKYRELDKKARELHNKYKSMQIFLKDHNLPCDKTIDLNHYEKGLYSRYLFYQGLKKAISESNEGGDDMACGKGKKKK